MRHLKNIAGMFFTLLFSLIVSLMAWVALDRIEELTKLSIRESLRTVLQTTQEAIYLWVHQREENILRLANTVELRELTKTLLKEYAKGERGENFEGVLKDVRDFLRLAIAENDDLGFFIINLDMINIASMRDSNIGVENLIYTQREEYITQVFHEGKVVFVPTVMSDVPLKDRSGRLIENFPTTFVAAPIRDESGSVIAALAFRIDPFRHFTRITQLGRIGDSGETYAFDRDGLLITESRFDHHLKWVSLIKPHQKGMLSIRITDPGGNLLEGYVQQQTAEEQPLTVMAKSATLGNSGFNIEGYRDYRGVPVFGVWIWDLELGFGMTTEIDKEEALRPFYETRVIIVSVLILVVILSTVLDIIWMKIRKKSEIDLKEARDRLELKVRERTHDLKEARDKLEEANRKLLIQASTDPLTNLANRRALDAHLNDEWRRCYREKRPLSALMIDIDFFKNFNDLYGHQEGDECLKKISLLLKSCNIACRPGDIIARYGGEEFCILLSNVDEELAKNMAGKILTILKDHPIEHEGSKVSGRRVVTLSIGVACESNFQQGTPDLLINRADQALYFAKSHGRNRVVAYSENKPDLSTGT